MISHKHKFIFTHIPKCAGSSIFESLGGKGYSNWSEGEKYLDNVYEKKWRIKLHPDFK